MYKLHIAHILHYHANHSLVTRLALQSFNKSRRNVLSIYFWPRGAFPLFVWSFSQNPEPKGKVSTIFCYKHFLPFLIVSCVPIPIPNAWTNFHFVPVRWFLSTSFYRVRYWGSERQNISPKITHLVRPNLDMAGALSDYRDCVLYFITASDGSIASNAFAKWKQTSFSWKCWWKSSVGTLSLLSWTLVWITPDSLETMKILSTAYLQMQYQVKTANYCPSGRIISPSLVTCSSFWFLRTCWFLTWSHLCTWHMLHARLCAGWDKRFEYVGLSFKEQNQCHHCFYMLTWKYYSVHLKQNNF